MTRYLFAALLSAALFAAWPDYAAAHAFLERTQPAEGAVVASAPASVRLWFSRPIEPAFSAAQVVDRNGKQVDTGKSALDAKDSKLLEIGLQPLAAGIYKVVWRVVALDGHKAKGEFTFTVK